jgi:FAD synthetase
MKKAAKRYGRRVMVFGTFDGLHPGHIHFLNQAKKLGDFLIVVVGRDRAVSRLKMKPPRRNERTRAALLKGSAIPDRVILGDAKQGKWNVIKKIKPDIVALGYDQKEIAKDLRSKRAVFSHSFRLTTAKAHQPRSYHSRILQRKNETPNLERGE